MSSPSERMRTSSPRTSPRVDEPMPSAATTRSKRRPAPRSKVTSTPSPSSASAVMRSPQTYSAAGGAAAGGPATAAPLAVARERRDAVPPDVLGGRRRVDEDPRQVAAQHLDLRGRARGVGRDD